MLTLRVFARRYALPLWKWYLAGLIFLAITNLITLEIPQLAKEVVNGLEKMPNPSRLQEITLLIIGLGVTQLVVRGLSRILIFWPGRQLEATSKSDFFSRVLMMPADFFLRHGLGDMISRLANDLQQIRVFFAFGVLQFFNLVFLFVFTLTKMLSVHQMLTLICLTPIALMLVVSRVVMPKMHHYSRLNQDALGRLTNRVTEAFMHVHVIQTNSAEDAFKKRAETENQEVYSTNMKLIAVRTLFFPLLVSLTGISQLLVLFYGGYQVMQGSLSVGDILAFNIYLSYLAFPLMSLGLIMTMYKRSRTALERLDLFETSPVEPHYQKKVPHTLPPNEPLLNINNLTFSYPKAAETSSRAVALKDMNLTLRRGEKVGIFGPVGSGKTTLFRLITRLYQPPSESIKIQGVGVEDFDPQKLRTIVGCALQSVHLFSDSIANNLVFGMEERPSREAMEAAAAKAQILKEIENFEQGWDTVVGEKGIRLSGGQKHRLGLARLFLRNPDLCLLDDVLAAVDNETEMRLIAELFTPERTLIIASHRTAALKACDRVIYLREGQVVAEGTYASLARRFPEMAEDRHDEV